MTDNDSVIFDDESEDDSKTSWKSKPDVWSDDVRMNALFAPFRNRDLNPLHYDAKLKFWRETIYAYIQEKEMLQFDLNCLETCFLRDNRKPKCLEFVLNEMQKECVVKTRDEALRPKNGSGFVQTVFNRLVWSPITWSANYLLRRQNQSPAASPSKSTFVPSSPSTTFHGSVSACPLSDFTSPKASSNSLLSMSFTSPTSTAQSRQESTQTPLVFMELLDKKSNEILKHLQSRVVYRNVDSVMEYDEFLEEIRKLNKRGISDDDLDLILRYLSACSRIIIDESRLENKKFVKFALNGTSNVEPINEIEASFQELRIAEKRIENESNKLVNEIDKLNSQIRDCMKQQNNKTMALRYLKKRKQVEKNLEHKDSIISNLQSMMNSIQQADTNKMTFDVYNRSVEALKEANKGLDIDKVEDTMCDIQDAIQSTNEIEEALSRDVQMSTGYDDKDLDRELEKLMKEQAEIEAKAKKPAANSSLDTMSALLDSLPDVPTKPLGLPNKILDSAK